MSYDPIICKQCDRQVTMLWPHDLDCPDGAGNGTASTTGDGQASGIASNPLPKGSK